MKDIIQSLEKALIEQNWIHGDRRGRIGHPYVWLNSHREGLFDLYGLAAVLCWFSMFYESYPTPPELRTASYEAMLKNLKETLGDCFQHYFPFLSGEPYTNYIDCTARVRAEDYSYIKKYGKIDRKNIRHIDIGPGLGSHAIYSRDGFESCYFGLEAIPPSYEIQRYFFYYLSKGHSEYYDTVAMERFSVSEENIKHALNSNEPAIYHVPSWKFPLIDDNSVDLVTATWVLNEITFSGLMWLMSNCMRTLKVGGLMYIRDSHKFKPHRHKINYDELLNNHGFQKIHQLDIQHRVTSYGIPRIYKKVEDLSLTFDDLATEYLGHFGVAYEDQE